MTRLAPHAGRRPLLPATPAPRDRGAALIVSLVLLLVLTVLGVTASRSSLMEERVTGNAQDLSVAFQAAEAALREGERFLRQPILPYFEGADGLYLPAHPEDPALWFDVDWNSTAVRAYAGLDDAPGSLAAAEAAWLVEELPPVTAPGESLAADAAVDEPRMYRITARGEGVGGVANVLLQSTFRR